MEMFEEARAMSGTLKLCNITQKELAERMGVSQSYVANKLRLLSLSSHLEKLIVKHGISERHARALLRLESEEDRLEILEKIISRDLTVRECEALVDIKVDTYAPTVIARAESAERIEAFTETLKRSLITLRSHGIEVTDTTSYYGNKMYVTLCFADV
ncbi:MAG: helix-turn-helix domain-containing protein [Clostridia bacterium]|jgi:ParB family chromosome partitioning protein|nr:helix-turn-helix domain-containing protein [Clostridia bacterium]